MSEFLFQALTVTGGASGVVALVVTWVVLKVVHQEKEQRAADAEERAALKTKLERLETERLAGLEHKIDDHVKADRSQEILAKMDVIFGAINRLTDSTTRALEANAGQTEKLAAHGTYLANLDKALQTHINLPHSRR